MVRTTGLKDYSDVHFTNNHVAKMIVDFFNPAGRVLEPFRGEGAFYSHLPEGSLWTELSMGLDFFDFKESVDWIITNPPFSNLTDIMAHSFTISKTSVFLVPLSKIYSSTPRMKLINEKAGIHRQVYLGTGRDIGFDIGFPFAAVECILGYKGPIYPIDLSPEVQKIKHKVHLQNKIKVA